MGGRSCALHFTAEVLVFLIKTKGWVFYSLVIAYILICAFIAYTLEPETFETFFNALWWVMTTLTTVGYGDLYPVTVGGKAFAMFLYVTGIGLIGVFLGKIIDVFSHFKRMREEGKMKYTGENHLIIVGWNPKVKLAIQEILQSEFTKDIVILDDLEKAPYLDERVFYVRGRATDEESLFRANISKAKGVIIFADQFDQGKRDMDDSLLIDGKTLLVATAITAVEQKHNFSLHVTVEVINHHHIEMFKHAKVDEFISSNEMVSYLAVRSLFSHGITNVYAQLMSRQYGDNLYEVPRRPQWLTYRDAFLELLEEGATLIADRYQLNINQKLHEPIPDDAKLYVICDGETYRKITSM